MTTKFVVLSCLLAVSEARHVDVERPLESFRILGGVDAQPGEFPHMVSLQLGLESESVSYHFCGGSIINDQWILTAAHCIEDSWPFIIIVKAGKHDLSVNEPSEQTFFVNSSFVHEKFIDDLFSPGPHDIGLIKLHKPLKFNSNVAPINLAKKYTEPSGSVILSGWGAIKELKSDDEMPNILQRAELEMVDNVTCENAFAQLAKEDHVIKDEDWIDETNICTGPLTGGLAPCIGDSGGSLINKDKEGKTEVVGIVSWGWAPCGRKGAPTAYAKVSHFIDWIEDTIAKN